MGLNKLELLADVENVIFYTTGTFSSTILPKICVKFNKKKLICNKTSYFTLLRVVLHIVVTMEVSKSIMLGKVFLRYLGQTFEKKYHRQYYLG